MFRSPAGNSNGSPPRGGEVDRRLVDNLTCPRAWTLEEATSNFIKDKCQLKDEMWAFTDVVSRRGSTVRWLCRCCDKPLTGGPQKIVAHV